VDIQYDEKLRSDKIMFPVVDARKDDIKQTIGTEYPTAVAKWEIRDTYRPGELVLLVRDGEKQAEEPFTSLELEGNGAFTQRLGRMKESLDHHGQWKTAVEELMSSVRQWAKDLPGAVAKDDTVTLNEERTGLSELPRVTIQRGNAPMWVQPVAEWTLPPSELARDPKGGASWTLGLAELRGSGGPIYVYSLAPKREWVYQGQVLHPDDNPRLYYPLDRQSFLKLAEVCFNG